jgi:hypothetical protein
VHRDIIDTCINLLVANPTLVTNLPSTAEITLRQQADKVILHVLHYIPQKKSRELDIVDVKIPLHDIKVKLQCQKQPSRIYTAPDLEELPYIYAEGYVSFTIPRINGHVMIVIEE